jgi:hypothetical protein
VAVLVAKSHAAEPSPLCTHGAASALAAKVEISTKHTSMMKGEIRVMAREGGEG